MAVAKILRDATAAPVVRREDAREPEESPEVRALIAKKKRVLGDVDQPSPGTPLWVIAQRLDRRIAAAREASRRVAGD